MKFINEKEERVKIRTGNFKDGFDWITVRPGQEVELDEEIGKRYGLTPKKEEEPSKPKKKTKVPTKVHHKKKKK